MAVDLFPAGGLQLWHVLRNGYWYAHRLTYLMSGAFHTLEWTRAAADTVFLLVGVAPLAMAVFVILAGTRHTAGIEPG